MTAVQTPAGDTDLAAIGSLLADPARAKVLLALVDGRALPASVLAVEAGVAASTVSYHLARLLDAGLVRCTPRGRCRYYTLAGPQVAELIETIARLAPARPITSLRQGTRAYALRYARRCYDHLAGRLGAAVLDTFCARASEAGCADGNLALTLDGVERLAVLGVTASPGNSARGCMDWTEQYPSD
jgi:DNA-binding transcriptional ArsR family regulator